jgi:hypothetical protein
MSDFYQNGVVTVLHRLGHLNVDQLERGLMCYDRINLIALVLPSLYAELGRPAWMVIVLHDRDITSYNREYLARLCYPIPNSNLGYEFCKGYYSRVTDRVRERVTQAVPDIFDRLFEAIEADHVWNSTSEPAADRS